MCFLFGQDGFASCACVVLCRALAKSAGNRATEDSPFDNNETGIDYIRGKLPVNKEIDIPNEKWLPISQNRQSTIELALPLLDVL
jgi:hypothetical protein